MAPVWARFSVQPQAHSPSLAPFCSSFCPRLRLLKENFIVRKPGNQVYLLGVTKLEQKGGGENTSNIVYHFE